jgi:predicted esterase
VSRAGWLPVELSAGASLRLSKPTDDLEGRLVVLGLGGSGFRAATPRWSASITWLMRRLERDLPELAYAELRYRDRSLHAIGESIRDAREALGVVPASSPIALLGFSMGGGIAIAVAGDPRVRGVIGLAPWVPDQISLAPLRGRRLAILHGSRDGDLPLLPGVSPEHSRRAMERAGAAGARTSYTLIDRAIHAIALRTPLGLVPLPHAGAWSAAVAGHLRELAD